jgi:metal-dependent amidase/aminoacylase/carboxypeptidase family protein
VAGHPVADPQTGAAHACGHNAQIAGLLGGAMGLAGANAAALLGADQVTETGHRSGSTAMGDSFRRGIAETELFNGAE